jgi:hypothetical protein
MNDYLIINQAEDKILFIIEIKVINFKKFNSKFEK